MHWHALVCLPQLIRPRTATACCRWFTQPTRNSACVTRAKVWRAIRLCRPLLVAQSQLRMSTASWMLLKPNCHGLEQLATLPSWQWASATIPLTTMTLTAMPSRWQLTTVSRQWCAVLHIRSSHWAVFELASRQIPHAAATPCHWHIGHLTASGIRRSLHPY